MLRSPAAVRAALLVFAGLLVLAAIAWQRTESLAGDPYAIYLPVAQSLLRGHGFDSFGPLWSGPGRHPGFPMLIALFGLATDDLIRAAEAVSVVSSGVVLALMASFLVATGARTRVVAAVVIICCSSWVFVRSAVEALPDAACLAAIAAAVVLLSERRFLLWGGGAIGVAVSIRPNAPVLIPAAIISLILHSRQNLGRRGAIFLGGLILGLSPFLGPVIGLNADGMKYPIVSTENNLEIMAGESVIHALYRHTLEGLDALPLRLGKTTTWPVLILGLPVLLYAAIKRRNALAISAAVFSAALCVGLLPFHYESRYYLFALIAFTPAAAIGVEAVIDRLRVPAAVGWLLWAALPAGVAIYTGRATSRNLESERQVAAELSAVCGDLARLADSPGATVLIGAGPGQYVYSRFRECPRPMRSASKIQLIDALHDDIGLDAFIGANGAPLPPGKKLRAIAGQTIIETEPSPLPTSTTAPDVVIAEPWIVRVPNAPRKTCETRDLTAEPGTYQLEAVLRTVLPAAARLSVTANGATRHLVGAGDDRPPVRTNVDVGSDGRIELRLCASDPLRAPGDITLVRLALARR